MHEIMERRHRMNVLDRLKLELSNKEYFSDEQYTQFLTENSLSATEEYDKQTMQKALLLTVIDVLEAIANDTDIMQSISTEFTTVGAVYKYIEQRIGQIKDKIASIPEPDEEYSCFSLMYTRGDDTPARTPSTGGGGGSCDCEDTTSISNSEIDKWF